MTIARDAIFLLTGPESDRRKVFGTGFAVAYKERQLYLLTCAHVVEQLDGKVMVGEQEAEIAEIGSGDSIDLALLRIPCNEAPFLLNTVIKGKPNKPVHLCGYGSFSGAQHNYILRPVKGRLGKSIAFESPGKGRIEAWDLHVKDDDFSKLQGGYSGSPLCDEEGRLIAVVSHEVGRTGERGHAIAVSNLKLISPDIEGLIPCFSVFDHTKRIQEAKVALVAHVSHLEEVFTGILLQLYRMDKKGVGSDDEEILGKIEGFIGQHITIEEFIRYFRGLNSRKETSETRPDYARLAENLNKGQVVLCLGQELSHLLGAPIPSTEEIIRQLVQEKDFYGPLSELCEQEEILPGNGGRHELVARVCALLQANCTAPLALYDLLARLDHPLLIISAAYDDLLEQ
ncbi:MAG: serine protease, partial [Candidatus Electrothrix sp. AUS3]|nr:serine protease [Candidatus Electrothrix gigas]